uniref:Uncharacterized protein n=1 Tax=Setaria digitata TaxID=48799 RepID=A0A915PXW1_9BILA
MSHYYTYTIEPLQGRQFTQRNFISLPEKASKYSNRAVTLNERFSIIERGYVLVPDLKDKKYDFQRNVNVVPRKTTTQQSQKPEKTSNGATSEVKK